MNIRYWFGFLDIAAAVRQNGPPLAAENSALGNEEWSKKKKNQTVSLCTWDPDVVGHSSTKHVEFHFFS